ncbi:MAG TPA: glycosyltransferase family 87 protein [Caulobacteraceae bacterium]
MTFSTLRRASLENLLREPGVRLARYAVPILIGGAVLQLVLKLSAAPLFMDFLAMWTGGHLAASHPLSIYNPDVVDRAQAWLLGPAAHDRPFPYPPDTLLVFQPLGALPFWTAAIVWMAVTVAVFCAVVATLYPKGRGLVLTLTLLAPGAIWAMLSGQCVFLTGALAIAGVAQLERRPVLAGVLLGAAAAFKPTVLLMAPAALIGGRHWRSLVVSGLSGLAFVALSALIWGPTLWLTWFAYAPRYLAAITANQAYVTAIVAPAGLAAQLGLSGFALLAWRLAFTGAGCLAAILVFRRSRALWPRLTALFGASLIATPYAMNYETTLLLPGAVLALLNVWGGRARGLAFGAYWALAFAGLPVVGPLAVLVYFALALACGRADETERPPSAVEVEPAVA